MPFGGVAMHRFLRRHSKSFAILLLTALSALDHAGAFGRPTDDDRTVYDGAVAIVIRVVDGDTLDISIPDRDSPTTRVRLWGIDAPEIAHANDQIDHHFGREAADFVEEHFMGRTIRLALDPNRPNRDKFGRLLAYIYTADSGEMLNALLVEEGLAYADPRFDHVMKHTFSTIEKRASKSRTGLWESVTPKDMPRWRRR